MGNHYDLIILGAGSGNSIPGSAFADKRVAIVEPDAFGGTCLNRGCIPTKMLVQAADVAYSAAHSAHLGVATSFDGVDWPAIRERVFGRIDPIAEGGLEYREGLDNVDVFRGTGAFVGERRLAVTTADRTTEISGEQIVVAVGARPHVPEFPGLDQVAFHTSDTIMRVDTLPKSIGIVGGGYIASEMAHVLGSFGVRVTLIVRGDRFLKNEDADVSAAFTARMRERFDCVMNVQPTAVGTSAAGVWIDEESPDGGRRHEFETLLIATGRTPNADRIGAAAGGIELTSDGRVAVDEYGRTSSPGVWALGDVCSPFQLKHVANHEARVVAHNVEHSNSPEQWHTIENDQVPHAVFGHPQIAAVGMTEAEARAADLDIKVAHRNYADTAWGWALEDTTSFVKLIMDAPSRRLLGAHIIGSHASTLIQPLVQMMRFGQTVDEIARRPYYIHPAPPEVIEQALLELC